MHRNRTPSKSANKAEKEKLICMVNTVWGKGKPENPRDTAPYGIKQIFRDGNLTAEQIADMVAEYFKL